MIQKVIKTALGTQCRPIIIVLGAYYNEINLEIKKLGNYDAFVINNKDWQQGMSASIKIGLQTLLAVQPDVKSALFLLADQPLLKTDYLQKIISQASENNIVASFYNDRPGVPALFDRQWFSELMQLSGDQGARKLLELHRKEIQALPFPEGAYDVDTPENFEFLKQQFE